MAIEYKKNKVKCDIGSYIHYLRGVKKSGKTTLFRDILLEEYGSTDYGIHISIGNETGADALDELYTIEAEDWAKLMEIRDDLIENRAERPFKLVCLDTVDELVKLSTNEILRLHKKAKGATAESLNAAFGGYGAGRKKVEELIDQLLADLRHAGYGIFLIGHTKLKDVKEKNGDEYQQLTSNLSSDFDGIFANKADVIMTISIDKTIDNGVITGTKRYMHFRDDGFVDCGSRFKGMVDKCEYGARNYIEAFENGVKSSMVKPLSEKEIKKQKEAEEDARNKAGVEFAKNATTNKIDLERNEEIISEIKSRFTDATEEIQSAVKSKMAEVGLKNFKDTEVPTASLEAVLAVLG